MSVSLRIICTDREGDGPTHENLPVCRGVGGGEGRVGVEEVPGVGGERSKTDSAIGVFRQLQKLEDDQFIYKKILC